MVLLVRGNLVQTFKLTHDGNVTAPSLTFASAPQSGIYHAGNGTLGISVNGAQQLIVSETGVQAQNVSGNGFGIYGILASNITGLQGLTSNASNITSGILGVARGGTGVSTSTGSGSVVLSTDPVFDASVTVQGNLRVGGNLVVDTGNVVYINTETQLTDQLLITNAGTGPALVARQDGTEPIVEFRDDANVVFKMYDGGALALAPGMSSSLNNTTTPPTPALLSVLGSVSSNTLIENRVLLSNASKIVVSSFVTTTELERLSGVTSNVQTQLDSKQPTITGGATTITGTDLVASRALVSDASGKVAVSAVSGAELGYVQGATSSIQTQLNGKQATITGGATTITGTDLVASRALVSDASGKVAVSAVSGAELGYVQGTTSSIQTQLNGKAASAHVHDASNISSGTLAVARGGTGVTTSTGTGSVVLNTGPTLEGLVSINQLVLSGWGPILSYNGNFHPLGLTSGIYIAHSNGNQNFGPGYSYNAFIRLDSNNSNYDFHSCVKDGTQVFRVNHSGSTTIQGHTIGVGGNVSVSTNLAVGNAALQNNTTGSQNTACGMNALRDNSTGYQNTACGMNALLSNSTGANNTACGWKALESNTTGGNNTACGRTALNQNTIGNDNTACGVNALLYNTTGNNNTACGMGALYGNTTGVNNTACGWKALESNTTGSQNTACGRAALNQNTTGTYNTACGVNALLYNTTGDQNTACGFQALFNNTTGVNNTACGINALLTNTTGSENVACGVNAMYWNTTGINNTACGVNSLNQNTTGRFNTACGYEALFWNTTGEYNAACGYRALYRNTSANDNTAFGVVALHENTTGSQNTACGANALYNNTTGTYNTACGKDALNRNTTGTYNTACGAAALFNNTTGDDNTACGMQALYLNTTGRSNTACGMNALLYNTTGNDNTACGAAALQNNTTGTYNTACGQGALFNNTTGNDNTACGMQALYWKTTGNFNTACGRTALVGTIAGQFFNFSGCSGLGYDTRCSADNQVQLGGSTTTAYVYGTVQNRSDIRDKADVRDTVLGLDFIEHLRPVDYKWDLRDDYFIKQFYVTKVDISGEDLDDGGYDLIIGDIQIGTVTYPSKDIVLLDDITFIEAPQHAEIAGHPDTLVTIQTFEKLVPVEKDGSKKRTRYHHGVIAQEVKETLENLQLDFGGYQWHSVSGGNDVYSIGYDEFIGPLIKAVQQLSAHNKALETRVAALENGTS